jgi:hypothetical protein
MLAEYQGEQAAFGLDGNIVRGAISSRTARRLIKEWALKHRHELMGNWKNSERGLPLNRIAPLE